MRTNPWVIVLAVALGACGQEPEATTPSRTTPEPTQPANEGPMAPAELLPADGATDTAATVELSWAPSLDPEGDAVTYDVLLDAGGPGTVPARALAEGLTDTYFAAELEVSTSYRWQVVARDAAGAASASAVQSFTTQDAVVAVLQTEAPWTGRSGFGLEVFDDRLWVIGGTGCCGGYLADVWSSPDGITWTEELSDAPFGPRGALGAAVHDGRLWVVGGRSSTAPGAAYDDVWSSTDGVTWVREDTGGTLPALYGAELAAYDGQLWLVGGQDNAGNRYRDRVWSSEDGATWVEVPDASGVERSTYGELVVHDDALWYVAGWYAGVQRTTDGVSWDWTVQDAPFERRLAHASASHDGRLWLVSGSIEDSRTELAEVWYSRDGADWVLASDDAGFVPVAYAEAVSFDGALWLVGGSGGYGDPYVSSEVYRFEAAE